MARVNTQVQLDERILELIERRATATGRDRDEVIEDALRRQLEHEGFQDALAKVRERSDLSDEQALELAYGELKAMRAEHRATIPKDPRVGHDPATTTTASSLPGSSSTP